MYIKKKKGLHLAFGLLEGQTSSSHQASLAL